MTGSMTYDGETFPSSILAAGTTVELCFSLGGDFQSPDTEWVHSVILTQAGPGFDYSTIAPSGTPPNSCDPRGEWDWYPTWTRCRTNCSTQTTFNNGYAFDSRAGTTESCGDAPVLDGEPGNNFGDFTGACGLVFCFTMETVDAPGIPITEAYQVNVQVNADGVSGGYSGGQGGFCESPCTGDDEICFPAIPELGVDILNEPCPGELFNLLGFSTEGPIPAGAELNWLNSSGNIVATGFNVFLPAGSYTFSVALPGCAEGSFEIAAELPETEFLFDGPDDGTTVCFGDDFSFSITVTGTTVNTVAWERNGTLVGSANSYDVVGATLTDAGTYVVTVNYGDGCDTMLMRTINVQPEIVVEITPVDAEVCTGNEITFEATGPGGSALDPTYTLSWDGGAGSDAIYTFFAGDPGPAEVSLFITDANDCTREYLHPYLINELPEVTIAPDVIEICFGQTADITPTVTGGEPPYDYLWGPDEVVTTEVLTIAPPYAMTLEAIYLQVTDNNGCVNFSNFADITIIPPPIRPNVSCEVICPTEILFTWTGSNADYYSLFATINAAPQVEIESVFTETEYLFTGLNPDDRVVLEVVPHGGDPNGENCSGPEGSASCRTPLTYSPGWTLNYPETTCVTGAGTDIEFTASVTEPGTFTFTSASLGLSNFAADADNTTTLNLPLPAGVSQDHQLTISYLGVGGRCPADTTITLTAVRAPTGAFSVSPSSVCAVEGTFQITLDNSPEAGANYELSLADPSVGSVSNVNASEWSVEIIASGTHEVLMVTSSSLIPSCTDTSRATLTLLTPPDDPALTCSEQGLDSVTFTWTDVGADSYLVDEISIPGGGVIEQNGTTFIVRGLVPGDAVTIAVTATVSGCTATVSDTITCVAQSCPPITPVITTPVDTFCLDGTTTDVPLTVTVPPTGSVVWNGPGVTGTNFNPASAGAGEHIISLVYTDGTCITPASFQLVVVDPPTVSLSAVSGTICLGETDVLTYTGETDPTYSYSWNLPSGTTILSGDPTTPGPLTVQFDESGDNAFSITVNTPHCTPQMATETVVVDEPLLPATLNCENVSFDQVGFAWSHPLTSDFTVNITDQPAGATINQTPGALVATGLSEGESVTIEVIAEGPAPCGNAPAVTLTCTARSCPSITVTLDPLGPYCVDEDVDVPLVAAITGSDGSGVIVWTLNGDPITDSFNPSTLTPGTYELIVTIDEDDCSFQDIINVVVNELPLADFNLADGPICLNEVVGASAGAEIPGSVYQWTSPDTDITITPGSDQANVDLSWSSPGRKYISLQVTNAEGCISEVLTDSIDVVAPLLAPVITCDGRAFDAVTFDWDDQAGVDSFRVEIVGQTTFFQDSSNLVIDGLNQGDIVTIIVTAFGSGPCGNSSATAPFDCQSGVCPTVTVTPPADEDFCLNSGNGPVALTATQSDGAPGGTFTFMGNGVTQDNGNFSWDPDVAGDGTHTITVTYDDGDCNGSASFVYTVFTPSTSNFTLNTTEAPITVCVDEVFTVAYTGDLPEGDPGTFDWEFDEADGGPVAGYETYDLSFPAPGTYTIRLRVTSNGCPGELTEQTVTVEAPLPAPVVTCVASSLNSVTFGWEAVTGATGYELSDGTTLSSSELVHTISGLAPGESANLTVTALSNGACGNSPASALVNCSADDCPTLSLNTDGLTDEVCLLDGDETIDLSTVIVTGGSGNGATYVFNGPGVTGTTFDAAAAGGSEVGTTHTITVTYTEEGPCTLDGSFEITVFERPSAFITQPEPACVDNSVRVLISSTNFVSNQNITVDWDGGVVQDDGNADDNDYTVSWDTPGTKTITATVISNISGCESLPASREIEIIAPLTAANISCGATDQENILFEWEDVPGATGYLVVTATGEFANLDAATTQYLVSNLLPGTSISITVTPTGNAPCNDGPESSLTCSSDPCPNTFVVATTEDLTFCLDGNETSIPLTAELSDGSPAVPSAWSGTGIEVLPDGTPVFNPDGLAAGTYTVYVDYDGPSICDSRDSVSFTLNALPFAEIGPRPTQACAGEPVSILLNGPAIDGVTYTWDFDGGNTTDQGNETYEVIWTTPGIKTITLTAMDDCVDGDSFTIDITPTLESPAPFCARQDLDAVLFEWPAIAAASEGYQVSVNGSEFGDTQAETSFLVSGLDFGQIATISVRAVRNGTTCDLSVASATVSCAARECPDVNMAPAAAQTDFCADETSPVLLRANLSGHSGATVPVWTGPGVILNANDSTYTFDPAAAGLGTHTLTVTYVEEGLCSYDASMEMDVFTLPNADFTVAQSLLCTNVNTGVALAGNVDPNATYTWDFSTATVNQNGGENYDLSWNVAGSFTISLTVTSNGCTSTSSQEVTVDVPAVAGLADNEALQRCVGTTELIDLNTQLDGADAGGSWSMVSGSGAISGSLNTTTGILNPAGLGVGNYLFAYTVSGGSCPDVSAEVAVSLLGAPVADAGPEQTLTCSMGMVSLNGSLSDGGEGYTYRWFSNDPNAIIMDADQLMIDVGQPGTYFLEVTNPIGCSSVAEVIVDAETDAPVMEIALSQITCFQADDGAIQVTNVSGGRPPYTYQINGEDRGTSTLFAGLEPRSYDLQITDANGCFSNIIIDLTEPTELSIRLRFPGDSNTVDYGEEILITASINGGNAIDTLIWQPDSLKSTSGQGGIEFIARETQMISVTVVDELGCSATDREMLLVRKDRPIYFPTAFSPNGDNINDIWFIGGDLDEVVSIQDFFIFDRWGENVHNGAQTSEGNTIAGDGGLFLPNDPAFGWDGRLNGNLMNPQVFIYTATVNFRDGETIVYKGDFVLMR